MPPELFSYGKLFEEVQSAEMSRFVVNMALLLHGHTTPIRLTADERSSDAAFRELQKVKKRYKNTMNCIVPILQEIVKQNIPAVLRDTEGLEALYNLPNYKQN